MGHKQQQPQQQHYSEDHQNKMFQDDAEQIMT